MSDTQILTIAAAVPTMLAVLVGIPINNSRSSDTNARFSDALNELRGHMDSRFDEMRNLWHSELIALSK